MGFIKRSEGQIEKVVKLDTTEEQVQEKLDHLKESLGMAEDEPKEEEQGAN